MRRGEGEDRRRAEALVALLTPIVKAHLTDLGCESASDCVQVMGGSGYIREFAVEQFLRDSRIAPIWEGTNGIQALDLVGRKIPKNMGRSLREFLWPIQEFVANLPPSSPWRTRADETPPSPPLPRFCCAGRQR